MTPHRHIKYSSSPIKKSATKSYWCSKCENIGRSEISYTEEMRMCVRIELLNEIHLKSEFLETFKKSQIYYFLKRIKEREKRLIRELEILLSRMERNDLINSQRVNYFINNPLVPVCLNCNFNNLIKWWGIPDEAYIKPSPIAVKHDKCGGEVLVYETGAINIPS